MDVLGGALVLLPVPDLHEIFLGLDLHEISMGIDFVAANPTNTFHADSSWTNPAGLTGLDRNAMIAGLQVVVPRIEFDFLSRRRWQGRR